MVQALFVFVFRTNITWLKQVMYFHFNQLFSLPVSEYGYLPNVQYAKSNVQLVKCPNIQHSYIIR